VTTNEGTPMNATNEPWKTPISAPAATAITIATSPGTWWFVPGCCNQATITPTTPLT